MDYNTLHNELKELRTETSKTFVQDNGEYLLAVSRMPVHYMDDDGKWRNVDLNIEDGELKKGIYKASLLTNDIGYSIVSRKDNSRIDVKLYKISNKKIKYSEPTIEGNTAVWYDIVEDVDFIIEFTAYRVRCWKRLKSKDASKTIRFTVIEDNQEKDLSVVEDIYGYDALNRELKLSKAIQKESSFVTEGTKKSVKQYEIRQRFENKIIVRDSKTRVKKQSSDFEYPLMIDADVTFNVTATGNDGSDHYYKTAGTSSSSIRTNSQRNGVYDFNNGGTTEKSAAYARFVGITIPQSSTINSATLSLYGGNQTANNIPFKVFAFDELNPAAPAAAGALLNKTAGIVTVNATTTFTNQLTNVSNKAQFILKQINVQNIVQNLVNSYNYTSDEMLFFYKASTTGTAGSVGANALRIYDHTWGATKAPELFISYTEASSSSSSSSTSSSSSSSSVSNSSSSVSSSSQSSSSSSVSSSSSSVSSSSESIPRERGFLKHIWYKLLDEEGVPIPSASVWLYEYASPATPLNVFDSNQDEITLPLQTDANGVLSFYVKDHIRSSTKGYIWDSQYILSWSKDDKSGIIRGDHLFGEFESVSLSGNLSRLNRTISNYIGWKLNDHINFNFGTTVRCGSSSSSSSSTSSTP